MIDDSTMVLILERCMKANSHGGAEAVWKQLKKDLDVGNYVIISNRELTNREAEAKSKINQAFNNGVDVTVESIREWLEERKSCS